MDPECLEEDALDGRSLCESSLSVSVLMSLPLVRDLVGNSVYGAISGRILGGGIHPSGQSLMAMGPRLSFVPRMSVKIGTCVEETMRVAGVSIVLIERLRCDLEAVEVF